MFKHYSDGDGTLVNPISSIQAQSISGLMTITYVGLIYLIPGARSNPRKLDKFGRRLDRFHPKIIRYRLLAVTIGTILNLIGIGYLIRTSHRPSQLSSSWNSLSMRTLRFVGFTVPSQPKIFIKKLVEPLILTMILFSGPIYTDLILPITTTGIRKIDIKYQNNQKIEKENFMDLIFMKVDIYVMRNLVFGPFLEEVVFRGCFISLNFLIDPIERSSNSRIIFLCPLWFGLAHVHSFWESYQNQKISNSSNALLITIIQTCFQFGYTTVFGWYASFIYLRTGSIIATAMCHSFCNYMGFPGILGALKKFPDHRNS
ncbi:hypothetical protein PPACK8108_LOCUS13830 [Phakopsora pachyrhizi]|uniref:intramembrane prenyl-peptidase Rce1 n=1 Tax=Phakopsora pachyrhizi TaxID=170000 RepID=A0AAV0B5I4_PHAPC|nr:hypothetical protein PPACK8108_LOCUS13830 [Phakopsora pachyrhizi]